MKTLRKFLGPLWWLIFFLPLSSRADAVDDLKSDISTNLPIKSHEDRVRQFLTVRKFKFTELRKERKITAECVLPKSAGVARPVTIVFQFDENGLLVDVTFPPATRSATRGQARLRSSQELPTSRRLSIDRL